VLDQVVAFPSDLQFSRDTDSGLLDIKAFDDG
jgi:hypothetical protein